MKITWHGHAFFEILTSDGKNVVIDPFTDNPKTDTKPEDLDPDLVLVTHGHYDHAGCVRALDAPVVANFEVATWLERGGHQQATGMNIGGWTEVAGVRVWMAPAWHSGGLPNEDGDFLGNGGNAYGFIIDDGEQRLYHAGDTGLFGDMKTVIGEIMKPDIALLPIGDLFTMGPEHGAIAAGWIKPKVAIPMHYNTFPAIEVNVNEFVERVPKGIETRVMEPDTTITV